MYPKECKDFSLIHQENDVLTNEELPIVKDRLKKSKHGCFFIRIEYPQGWVIINGESNKGKNPKRVEAGKKGYEARMLKMKKEIFPGSNAGTTGTNAGSNATTNAATTGTNASTNVTNVASSDAYVFNVG